MSSLLPLVDLRLADASAGERVRIGGEVRRALHESGFLYVQGLGLEPGLVKEAFAASRGFFARPQGDKDRFAYTDVGSNFGYQGIEGESLDPAAPPDLKEAFTMRGAILNAERSADGFQQTARDFFHAAFAAAGRLLGLLASGLDLPEDFFSARHGGENVTLRFLHYPSDLTHRGDTQLGAGAHTDYGSVTLLFQDDVGGLELCGADGTWQSAPPVPGAVLVNAGDLMERWTNAHIRSTLHRVRRVTGARDRFAIALFVDPDSDVLVECLPSCQSDANPPRFSPITAGEHVRRKLAASPRPSPFRGVTFTVAERPPGRGSSARGTLEETSAPMPI